MSLINADTQLRILQISPVDISGGAEKVAYSLHCLYRSMGHVSNLLVRDKLSSDRDVRIMGHSGRRKGILAQEAMIRVSNCPCQHHASLGTE